MKRILATLVFTIAAFAVGSYADTINAIWNAQGNWTNSAIWQGGNVPGSNDLAVLKHGNVDITTARTLDGANFGEYNTAANGHLGKVNVLSGGSLYVTQNLTIGARDGNAGELSVNGGDVSANYIRLGGDWSTARTNAIGTLNITDGHVEVRNYNGAEIGRAAAGCVGTVNIYSNGIYEAIRIKVGSTTGATGIVNVVEGTLKLTRNADNDTIVMNNGTVNVTDGNIQWVGWRSDVIQALAESGDLTWDGTTTNMLFDSYTYTTNNGSSVLYSYDYNDGSAVTTHVWSVIAGEPPATTTVIDYQFNDAAGTQLKDLQNDGSAGMFDANATNMLEATGTGFLKWQNTSTNDGSWRVISLPGSSTLKDGVATMEWRLDSWSMTDLPKNASIKMVFGNSIDSQEIRTVVEVDDASDNVSGLKIRMRDSTPSNKGAFNIANVSTNGGDGYVFRVVNDLDAGTTVFEYRTDSGSWTDLTPSGGDGLTRIDWVGVQLAKGWTNNTDAFAHVDYLIVSHEGYASEPTEQELYQDWLALYPAVGTATNATDNPDGDVLNNLYEYALDGDPDDVTDLGNVPVYQMQGEMIEYVYYMRDDADDRGLTYSIGTKTDLVDDPVWTNLNVTVAGISTNTGIVGFNAVTNHVSTETEDVQFIKLLVDGNF